MLVSACFGKCPLPCWQVKPSISIPYVWIIYDLCMLDSMHVVKSQFKHLPKVANHDHHMQCNRSLPKLICGLHGFRSSCSEFQLWARSTATEPGCPRLWPDKSFGQKEHMKSPDPQKCPQIKIIMKNTTLCIDFCTLLRYPTGLCRLPPGYSPLKLAPTKMAISVATSSEPVFQDLAWGPRSSTIEMTLW